MKLQYYTMKEHVLETTILYNERTCSPDETIKVFKMYSKHVCSPN